MQLLTKNELEQSPSNYSPFFESEKKKLAIWPREKATRRLFIHKFYELYDYQYKLDEKIVLLLDIT
jgi:hypothetical protein